jgi:hypothetical protein
MAELLKEPPLRIIKAAFVKRFSGSLRSQELWDTWDRPEYLTGVLYGADQAQREGEALISAIEFGVAQQRRLSRPKPVSEFPSTVSTQELVYIRQSVDIAIIPISGRWATTRCSTRKHFAPN